MSSKRSAISLFEASTAEPSRLTAFAGNRLDRQSEIRPVECLEEAFLHEETLAYAVLEGDIVLGSDDGKVLFRLHELNGFRPEKENAVLLGYTIDGAPRVMLPLALDRQELPPSLKTVDCRTLYMQQVLPPAILGEVAQGASLVAWNASARFCGRCGGSTLGECGGYRRRCQQCNKEFFPRTDPVVIMLAVDEQNDRCLLGRSPHFRPGMFSCLAGFLEPGETIEDAVRRETLEEAGIELGRIRYHASQPWPFPHSLMIGCYGEALSTSIRYDSRELEDCRWFSRREILKMLKDPAEEGPSVPPSGSIAHRLLLDWSELGSQ